MYELKRDIGQLLVGKTDPYLYYPWEERYIYLHEWLILVVEVG